MRLSRDRARIIHFLFDECLPPLVRDAKWVMWPVFKLVFGRRANIFFEFKEEAPRMSKAVLRRTYIEAASAFVARETDLNRACINEIERQTLGPKVLDIGCGRGYLAKRLAQTYDVTAADLIVDPRLKTSYPHIHFCEADVEALPFRDHQFDTVISAHTLEHTSMIHLAVQELRRVARRRLIIVVPKQRYYKYTFDLHLHFFPHPAALSALLAPHGRRAFCQELRGDLLYVEDMSGT